MIEKKITVDFEGKKFTINFPNVGQMLDIESLKQSLTGNRYGSFSASGVKSMYFILDTVDTIAFLSVMCPKMKNFVVNDTNEEIDYLAMQGENIKPLIKVYKEQILPWYVELSEQLYNYADEQFSGDEDAGTPSTGN